MNNINIYLGRPTFAELDAMASFDIALNYSIADVKDISKRNAAFSKTITLPGTKKNNYWFGGLFDINSSYEFFNPNKKVDCRIVVNTEVVMDGYLQLRKIKKLENNNRQGGLIEYECVVFNNAVDLMKEIGEKTIKELDLSFLNHTYSLLSITSSWTNTWDNGGYVYPMYGFPGKDHIYEVRNFYPNIFYRTLFDKIIYEAGFGWGGALADNEQFNKEVISFVTDGNKAFSDVERERRQFAAGRTASYTSGTIFTWGANVETAFTTGNVIARLDDDTTDPLFDNDNNWNTTLWQWEVDAFGRHRGQVNLDIDLIITNSSGSTATRTTTNPNLSNPDFLPGFNSNIRIEITRGTQTILWTQMSGGEVKLGTVQQSPGDPPPTLVTIANGQSVTMNLPLSGELPEFDLETGDIVKVYVSFSKGNNPYYYNRSLLLSWRLNPNSIFKNTALSVLVPNQDIEMNAFLSDKIKQKDLISDLIKRYNIYIQTDPDNPRKLIIDPRPDYFDRDDLLDWTDKKDFSFEDVIEFLPELQNKETTFRYKPDSDLINKQYEELTGDTYGQFKKIFDNDFVKGENIIESPFSPTPLIKTDFGAVVSAIDPVQPKVQPRVLLWGGTFSANWLLVEKDQLGATVSYPQTHYPYAGHLDNPFDPQLDINFGPTKFLFYDDIQTSTRNNMYNTYWSDYMRQIETGKMVIAKFNLNEIDIAKVKDKFWTKIFVLDSYFYLNRIIDYKPLQNETTLVELIKVQPPFRWKPQTERDAITIPSTGTLNGVSVAGRRGIINGDLIVVGRENTINNYTTTAGGFVTGTTSFKEPQITYQSAGKQFILGSGNNIGGNNILVQGDGNQVTSSKATLLSSFNNVVNAEGVVAIGVVGATLSQKDSIYLGENFVINTKTGNITNSDSTVNLRVLSTTTESELDFQVGNNELRITATGIFISGTSATYDANYSSFYTNRSLVDKEYVDGLIVTAGATGATGATGPQGPTGVQTLSDTLLLGNTASRPILLEGGSVGIPSIAFISDQDTGMYRVGNNILALTTGGTSSLEVGLNYIRIRNGTVTEPSISFFGDGDTGMYRPAANQLGFTINGVVAGRFVANSGVNSFTGEDGTVARPGIGFFGDLDTGIWRPTTNQVGIAAGGATAAVFGSTNSITNRTYFEKAVNHTPVVNASVSGTYSIDMASSNVFNLTLTGNTTLDYTNSSEGSYMLLITQDGTGGRTLNFASGGKFIGATAVSIATASNAKSIVQLIHIGTQSIVTYQTNLINL